MKATFFAGLLAATGANAHMIMTSPTPYGVDTLNNSPLDGSGSDFPCKQRSGVYDVTTENKLTAGSSNPLRFAGSAVHGGGSCQISLTTDREPTKDSTFRVIASYIGGCPGVDGGPSTNFSYTIPDSVKDGQYTLAWTWFNKIGNREMYMNCAPVTISGSSAKDSSAFDKLPLMFEANIGNGCTDTEMTDLDFPDPGQVVVKSANATPGPPVGNCASGSGSGSSSGSGTGSSPGSSSGSAPSSSDAGASPSTTADTGAGSSSPAAPSSAAPTSNNGGIFAPGAASTSSAAPTPSKPAASASATVTASTATLIATPSATSTRSSGSGSEGPDSAGPTGSAAVTISPPAAQPSAGTGAALTGTSCTNEGGVVCSPDGSLYGLCNHGYAVFQILAAGTICSDGAVIAKVERALPPHRYNRRYSRRQQ